MKNYRFSLLLLGILLGILLGGCAESTAPASGPIVWKNPPIGELITWSGTAVDSSQYGFTEQLQDTFRVIDSNLNIGGKIHVNELSYSDGVFTENIFTAYEANGNFSIGDSAYNGYTYEIKWTTYPTASGGSITDPPIVDSVTEYGDTISETGSRTYVDEETITIGGISYQAIRLNAKYSDGDIALGDQETGVENAIFWFFPEIGFFGKGSVDEVSISIETGTYVPSESHLTEQYELSTLVSGAAPESGKSGKPQSISPNGGSKLLRALLPHSFNKAN
jgi:hypothetical protein